jgi:hypothetical protein
MKNPIVRLVAAAFLLNTASICLEAGTIAGRWEGSVQIPDRGLASERKFNGPFLFYSSWREAPIVATDRQFGIGAIFSSPLIAGGVVYFGSTDSYLYAVE